MNVRPSPIITVCARTLAAALLTLMAIGLVAPAANADQINGGIFVRLNDLPRRVRETIERERGRHEVKQIIEFRHEGRLVFRVLIDERGSDRAILIAESGMILKETEVPDLPTGRGWFERSVAVGELPVEVRRTLEQERRGNPIKSIVFVRRDNREFFRAIVDTRGDDLAIRINSVGKLLSIEEVDDFAVGGREASRFDYNRERAVRVEELPWTIQRVIERERRGQPLKQVVLVERNGREFYRVVVDQRRGDLIVRISLDGFVYAEDEVPDIATGSGRYDANRFGHESPMRYTDLPWAIKETLDRERRGRDVKEIIYVRRFSHSFYRCLIDTRGDDLAIRINDEGTVVSREQVEDTAIGRPEIEQIRVREEWVRYSALPERVRHTLDRLAAGKTVLKITRVDARSAAYYRCMIETRPYPTTILITEEGRVIGQ